MLHPDRPPTNDLMAFLRLINISGDVPDGWPLLCGHKMTKTDQEAKREAVLEQEETKVYQHVYVRAATCRLRHLLQCATGKAHVWMLQFHGGTINACHMTSMTALTGHQCISAGNHVYAAFLYACVAGSAQECKTPWHSCNQCLTGYPAHLATQYMQICQFPWMEAAKHAYTICMSVHSAL